MKEASSSIKSTFLFSTDLYYQSFIILAGVPGFEPGLMVLETIVLAINTIPLR